MYIFPLLGFAIKKGMLKELPLVLTVMEGGKKTSEAQSENKKEIKV